MPAVADSSVIIHLAAIAQLDLLRQLHGSLLVPPAVWDEVVVQGQGRAGAQELTKAVGDGWVTVAHPSSNIQLPSGGAPLHPGETEAVLLAASHPGSLLLMDEAAGRSVAASLGIPVMGIVGVLVVAKQSGLVAQLKPILEQLRSPGGFRLSAAVFQHALTLVGEQP
jgi:predicted nucleic acid-binding protein